MSDRFKIIGTQRVCGVEPGGTVTADEIEEQGGSVEHLVTAGHIKKTSAGSTVADKSTKKEMSDG